MIVVWSILAGFAWGAIFGLAGAMITKKIASGDEKKIASLSMSRMMIDLAALAAIYFARNLLPLRFEVTLITAAITLSLFGIIAAFRIAASLKDGGPASKN